ncbi:hypothetical protein U9M48_039645 [Paspalum notatum var. saurae]|uniref:Uncharacterized protein n=1 Tax=Paspalum notatum var. saurae TaxID=547442 RepID=A0AAQ3XBK9_PASNO
MNRKGSRRRTLGGAATGTPFGAAVGAPRGGAEDPAVDPEDPKQDPDDGNAPPSDDDEDNDEAGPVVTTTHRRFDYPPPVPRMPREMPEMLHYDRFPDHLCGDSLPPSRPTR